MYPVNAVVQRRPAYLADPVLQPGDYVTASPVLPPDPSGYLASPLFIQNAWQEIATEIPNWRMAPDFWQNYTNLAELGSGFFGAVYKVLEQSTGELKVLKVFNQKPSSDTEYQVLRQLSKVCPNMGFPETQGLLIVPSPKTQVPSYAILMDWIPGQAADEHRYTDQEILIIGRQVLGQLQCMHQAGLVHGDIKPDNILVDMGPPLRATLIDYGSVCSQRAKNQEELTQQLRGIVRCTGCLGGHSDFWAPEIDIMKIPFGPVATPRSDLWALGVTLWLLLHPADYSLDKQLLIQKIKASKDSGVNNLIKSMVVAEPAQRPSTNVLINSIDSSLGLSQ
jgi:serine/threonine protein kinase